MDEGEVKCMSNLRQVGQGLASYFADNRNRYRRTHYLAVG